MHGYNAGLQHSLGIDIAAAGDLLQEMLRELRKRGRWRMVEVKTPGCEVSIDFY